MKNLGDFAAGTVLYDKFTTYQPSTGAPFLLGGTPALSVYKNADTTQTTTGVTLTANFDSVTGLNHYAIDTSADGTFYSTGSFFQVVITTGTVDGVSAVGTVVAVFTLAKTTTLATGSVTGNVSGNVTGSIGSLATQAKADVNAEVVDALAVDTYAEPGQAAPPATTTLAVKIGYQYKAMRNKKTQTATQFSLYNDAGDTVDQKSTTSDDGTTFTQGEIGSGP